MTISVKEKKEIVINFGKDEKNTGSTEVQVAILTKKINSLTEHLKITKKSSFKERAFRMINNRRKLLKYLRNKSEQQYTDLIKKLGLRK